MLIRKIQFILIMVLLFTGSAWCEDFSLKSYDMRGDMGVLEDFGPRGVCWTPDGQLFVVDRRYTVFHIFDTQGRRYRFLNHPEPAIPEASFSGVCVMPGGKYLATGNHYHVKNSPRYLTAHSVMHLMELAGEAFTPESGKINYSPDSALRATGYYGDSPDQRMEISGIAVDPAHNRIFIGCSQPLMPDGTVTIFEGKLDKFLLRSDDFKWDVLKTGLKPPVEPALNKPMYLSDITYVPDRGLVLLMASQNSEEKIYGSSQIWFMRGGAGVAKLVQKELAPGNRATGIAIRATTNGEFEAAVVCDNRMEDTKIPNRLVMLRGLRLPTR